MTLSVYIATLGDSSNPVKGKNMTDEHNTHMQLIAAIDTLCNRVPEPTKRSLEISVCVLNRRLTCRIRHFHEIHDCNLSH
jgi:hypothetical protein